MNLVNKTIIALATGVVLTTSAAHATGGQPYFGAKIGQFDVDADDSDINLDKPTAYGVYGGYSFNKNLAVEAEYIKSSDADVTVDGFDDKSEFNAETIGLYGVYRYNLPNQLDALYVKGKLGVARSKVDAKGADSVYDSGVAGGLGLGYDLTNNVSIEGEYTKLPDPADDASSDLWTIGAHYRF